jgi:hypothetical protein
MVHACAYLSAHCAAQRLAVYFSGTLRHLSGRGPDNYKVYNLLFRYLLKHFNPIKETVTTAKRGRYRVLPRLSYFYGVSFILIVNKSGLPHLT